MSFVWKYVALYVQDLRKAEDFYCRVLGLELLFRESHDEDEVWRTLRPELGWSDADARGIQIGMVALGRDGFVLALFAGAPEPGTVYELCVGVEPGEIDAIHARARDHAVVVESSTGLVRFEDPFGFRWVVQSRDARFRSSGEIAGRWTPPV